MSRGHGKIERRIGELFAATKDRALSVGELAAHAFELTSGVPNRKQRLSATRAAHRLLRQAAAAREAVDVAWYQMVAETTAALGRPPNGRSDFFFPVRPYYVAVDKVFQRAMLTVPGYRLWEQACHALKRRRSHFGGVLIGTFGGWCATEAVNRRLWFHPANYPVRVWAVAIQPQGVVWADAEITGIDNTYVRVRYQGQPARLSREKLARAWTIYRNVYFTSARSGHAARAFDQMWQERYWRAGAGGAPPVMQMLLADAVALLGVPADFTREDIIAAFRRKALRCHPDHGNTEEQFIALVKARDRLLAALGTKEAAPKMPEFAPAGVKLRYGKWRPDTARPRPKVGQTRRVSVSS
jgi:hypothetical protein